MISLITMPKAQKQLAEALRRRRLSMRLTQAGLAKRSGVPLPTLRKFEQKGMISLESFLKILLVVGGINDVLKAVEGKNTSFSSIDDVLEADNKPAHKRGTRA